VASSQRKLNETENGQHFTGSVFIQSFASKVLHHEEN